MRFMEKNFAIGVLDSGVGGLTVAKEIMRQLPKETIYYFGDTNRCPYGPRSKAEVQQFTLEIVEFLMQFPLKAIVIACNTASAAALEEVQKKVSIPVIGVIGPGSRAALKVSKQNHITVIGTKGTIASHSYRNTLKMIQPNVQVYELACPTLASLVENHLHETQLVKEEVTKALLPLKGISYDTLVLGCTHYPHLEKVISSILDDTIHIISSSEETAIELSAILQHQNLLADTNFLPQHHFFTTGEPHIFENIASAWLECSIRAEHVNLEKSLLHTIHS